MERKSLLAKFAETIVDRRNLLFLFYIIVIIFSLFSMGWVEVEDDIVYYLDKDSNTRQGITIMEEEFTDYGMANIMVSNISLSSGHEIVDLIEDVPGVKSVMFENTESHYKNSSALMVAIFQGEEGDEISLRAMEDIREIVQPYDSSISTTVGVDMADQLAKDMTLVDILASIVILIVLTFTTYSYAEIPILLITFGVAAILNMGSNFMLGKISFISNSVGVILQLALAIDYAIILSHRFSEERKEYSAREAAIEALRKAIPEVSSSSLTTMAGLAALGFMQFGIGLDLAVVMIKAILLSMLSVFTLMPGLLVISSNLIDKTKHRSFIPSVSILGRFSIKTRYIIPPIFLIVLIGAFIFSSKCPFLFSMEDIRAHRVSDVQLAEDRISGNFGKQNMLALIVPSGDYGSEKRLLEDLLQYEEVEMAMGLSNIEAMGGYMLTDSLTPRNFAELIDLDYEIAQLLYSAYAVNDEDYSKVISGIGQYGVPLVDMIQFLYEEVVQGYVSLDSDLIEDLEGYNEQLSLARKQMEGDNYSRMIVYLNLPEESEETFNFISTIYSEANKYYPEDSVYLIGESTNALDLSTTFDNDNLIISILSALFVVIILTFTFQSAGLPILLISVIQASIWINFSFPYINNQGLYFLGYLLVSSIQMGANIDYAIIITSRYQDLKKDMDKGEAVIEALNQGFPTVITSGTILAVAGILIGYISTDGATAILGTYLGQGTIISIFLVIFVLPQLLYLGDVIIEATSFKLKGMEASYKTKDKIRVQGRIHGYVRGEIDAIVDGTITGEIKAIAEDGSDLEKSPREEGRDTIGGIVGFNSITGKVINSSFNGIIHGEGKVGGIVGYNAGTILRSTNYSSVNTTVEDQQLGLEDITIENISFSKIFLDATDIGGIAGVNTGILQNSKNYGIVGYPHVGYNVGGIAGRQSGYITSSLNYGKIYGRKEVAGIVGQIEPHISSTIQISKLKKLQRELNLLDSSITKLIDDGKGTTNITTDNLLFIQGDIDRSKIHAESLIDQTESMINKDIDEINKISVIGVETLDRLIPITEDLEKIMDGMGKAMGPLKLSMEYMSRMMHESDYMTGKFKSLGADLGNSITRILKISEELEESYDYINEILELLKAINTGEMGDFEGTFEDIMKILEVLQDLDISQIAELLGNVMENVENVSGKIRIEINKLEPLANDLRDIMISFEDISGYMSNALDSMIKAMDIMEDGSDGMDDIFEGVNGILKFLTENGDLKFETSNDLYQKTKDDLYGTMGDVSSSLSRFIEDIKVEGNLLMDDIQAVSDQLFKIMNLMINMIEEITNGDVIDQEDIVKDVSRDDIEKQTEGKVSDCKNFGKVEGDLNVGGIVGGMSIELIDPEIDLDLKGKLSYNTVFESRAIVLRCENTGSIIGKKDNVGGIVGNMALGYIQDCIVSSSVESLDGNYVGGIAGRSDAAIVSTYARASLEGGNYVGGISGLAREIINSYSLVKVKKSRACVGAIAGNIDGNSKIRMNYFVSDELRGIDGISYFEKAQPITYEELIAVENLPNIFKNFKLSFWADDKIVDSISFNYGDSISKEELPKFPSKEGYYGKWEGLETNKLSFDKDIHAIYTPYLTILESEEKRDDLLAIVLVEGLFIEGDSINLIKNDGETPNLEKEAIQLEQWDLEIPEDGNTKHIIRFIPSHNKKSLEIYVKENHKWIKTKSKWDGKYLVFEANGNSVSFSIWDMGISYMKYIYIVLIIVLLMASIAYTRRKRKKIEAKD